MQSSKEVDQIVQEKVRKSNNDKTIEQMQAAIDDIKKERKIDKVYAYLGLIIIIPAFYYLFKLFTS